MLIRLVNSATRILTGTVVFQFESVKASTADLKLRVSKSF